LFGFHQGLADAPIHPHLVVDRLAGSLELLLMLVLGGVEQLADDAVVQVDDFVGDGGHAFDGQRYQSGVAPLHLELGQVGGRHLPTLAGDLEQAVLVNLPLDACGQVKRLPALRRSMCSSMCREFGLTGDWRSHASHVICCRPCA
jgi:hypothetical protein